MKRRSILRKAAALCAAALLTVWIGAAGLSEGLPISVLIAMQHENRRTGDFQVASPESKGSALDTVETDALYDAMAKYAGPSTDLLVNRADYYYYYDHLNPLCKEMYDLILQVVEDPVSEGNIALMLTDIDPNSDEFQTAFDSAYFAVTFDHPELFWLYNGSEADISYSWARQPINGRYTVFIAMKEPFTDFVRQMNAFNAAAEGFLAGIDRNASQYEIAKQIHDKMVNLVTYDLDVSATRSGYRDLAHTAYGALVANSSGVANYAVCDGISLAYEYLLQQCGVPAVFIGGYGGDDREHMGGHAWSMVCVDGVWYETDLTWDENTVDETFFDETHPYYKEIMQTIHDPVYREKITHYLFLISSDNMEHFVPDEAYYTYDFGDGRSWCLIGENMHERDGTGLFTDADDPYGAVIYLAPRAGYDFPD